VSDDAVADDAVRAGGERMSRVRVADGVVVHVAAGADDHTLAVAARHGARPDADAVPGRKVADGGGGWVDEQPRAAAGYPVAKGRD
jgi:hypothetical protein